MDAGMTFARPITDRYFEDYVEGDVHHFGTIAVEADELIAFAKPASRSNSPLLASSVQEGNRILFAALRESPSIHRKWKPL